MENPYKAPDAIIREEHHDDTNIEDVATGQKRVIYAALLYMAAGATSVIGGENPIAALLVLVIALAFLFLGWTGIYKISRGLGHSMVSRIFIMLIMIIPFIGLITLLITNSKATKALRSAGYTVGLIGARRKQA